MHDAETNSIQFHQDLKTLISKKLPSFNSLPASDPAKILVEMVSQYAFDLYSKVKPETEKLFSSIPTYLGLSGRVPEGTKGIIFVERTMKDKEPILLPKGSECFAESPNGPRRFVTTENMEILPLKQVFLESSDEGLLLGIPPMPSLQCARLFLFSTSGEPSIFQGMNISALDEAVIQPIEFSCEHEGAGVFFTVPISHIPIVVKSDKAAHWFRVRLQSDSDLNSIRVLPNPVRVCEEAVSEEVFVGISSGLQNQSMPLSVFPTENSFSIRVDGDRELWSRVDSFSNVGPAEKVFRFDSSRNAMLFGDGKNGMVLGPAGKKVYLKKIVHRGNGEMLLPNSIRRVRADHPEIVGAQQPLIFEASQSSESEEAKMDRFRAELFTQQKAFSLSDYEKLARAFSPESLFVKGVAKGTHAIKVIVSSVNGIQRAIRTQPIEHYLNEVALLHQTIEVVQAKARHIGVEARLRIRPDRSSSDVELKTILQNRVKELLGPRRNSENPFGGVVTRNDVRSSLERCEGVLEVTAITLQDQSTGIGCATIELREDELPEFEFTLSFEGSRQ